MVRFHHDVLSPDEAVKDIYGIVIRTLTQLNGNGNGRRPCVSGRVDVCVGWTNSVSCILETDKRLAAEDASFLIWDGVRVDRLLFGAKDLGFPKVMMTNDFLLQSLCGVFSAGWP